MSKIKDIMDDILDKHKMFWCVLFIIYAKIIFFHCICFGYLPLGALFENTTEFLSFYLSKVAPAILIASLCFIVKRNVWIVMLSFLIDIWLIANIIYFKIFGFFLNEETLFLASNMSGYWNSILPFVDYKIFIFIALSFFLCICWYFHKKNDNRYWRLWGTCIGVVVIIGVFNWFWGYKKTAETKKNMNDGWKYNCISAVQYVKNGLFPMYNWCLNQWYEAQSPLHFFIAWPYSLIYNPPIITLTSKDKGIIDKLFVAKGVVNDTIERNLIVIIGESFESWVFGVLDEKNFLVAPNLTRVIKDNHVLYSPQVKSQVLRGSSGDGQMIINTGLLPISSGAACMSYKDNVYPNFANAYENSFVINPAGNVWNQKQMTENYGYKNLIQKNIDNWNNGDSIAITEAINVVDTCKQLFAMQIITVTTHTPFDCNGKSNMTFPKEMPIDLCNYLNCMHYADSCIGLFLKHLEKDSLMGKTTIVITGDHTIFKKSKLQEYQEFARKYGYPIPKEESYCPLIVISPNIRHSMEVDEICYQMDIFPTILNCIGAEEYYWKGFGVNLLDSVARINRKITEEDAYILSDKIIRSNFFK